jgi:hypothetical protein
VQYRAGMFMQRQKARHPNLTIELGSPAGPVRSRTCSTARLNWRHVECVGRGLALSCNECQRPLSVSDLKPEPNARAPARGRHRRSNRERNS